ncbi:hypothetical protein [Allomuricauda sp. SCSIO 65647]|uniref:hypothetical protein n=1 Tax=Allomuricauda sp. SCSIO 65647 TaxID=2908843 RepID=UPI001F2703CE|nr:hypothetical protein [Muricauda sp. SCSIO 65647]UJH67822.1 hypothetical protein L0P89_01050 [Muricauda sp. SCSIO 65647]
MKKQYLIFPFLAVLLISCEKDDENMLGLSDFEDTKELMSINDIDLNSFVTLSEGLEKPKSMKEYFNADEAAVTSENYLLVGRVAPKIRGRKLVKWNHTGSMGKPQSSHDIFRYGSWILNRLKGTINIPVNLTNEDLNKRFVFQVTWAGWGEKTLVDILVNDQEVKNGQAVYGSAWGNPGKVQFALSPILLQEGENTITIRLNEKSKKVLFLKNVELLADDSFGLFYSIPEEGATNVRLYETMYLVFTEDITIGPDSKIIIRPQTIEDDFDIYYYTKEITLIETFVHRGKVISLPMWLFYWRSDQRPVLRNMEVVAEGIHSASSNAIVSGPILTFTTGED